MTNIDLNFQFKNTNNIYDYNLKLKSAFLINYYIFYIKKTGIHFYIVKLQEIQTKISKLMLD